MIGNDRKNIIGFSPSLDLASDTVQSLQSEGILLLSAASGMRLKRAIERIAGFFSREMGYDSIQFLASECSGSRVTVRQDAKKRMKAFEHSSGMITSLNISSLVDGQSLEVVVLDAASKISPGD